MEESITISSVIKTLNDLNILDNEAISKLFKLRVPCNEDLANHPTCQVRKEKDGTFSIALGGIINSFFSVDTDGYGGIARELPKGTEEKIGKFIPVSMLKK